MLLIIVLTILTSGASGESCYNCAERLLDDPTIGDVARDASVLCNQESILLCPTGTKCQAFLLHADVHFYGIGGDYKVLNSTCVPHNSDRNACQDEKDDIENSGGSMTIYSCDAEVDVQSSRLIQDEPPTEPVQCFECMELDMGGFYVRGMYTPCNKTTSCMQGQFCNQLELEMRYDLNPTQNIKVKLGQCAYEKFSCDLPPDLEAMMGLGASITNCNDNADFSVDNAEDEDHEGESVEPVKCFNCIEYKMSGVEDFGQDSKCDKPIMCMDNEMCNQIEIDMASDTVSLTMKYAQCSPYKMTCEQIETMASEYQQMLNVSFTSCNDEADFFKDMDNEKGGDSGDEGDGNTNDEDSEDQEQDGESIEPAKCFNCMEYDISGVEGFGQDSKCDQPIMCMDNEICNQIEIDMASDKVSLTMKYAQCSPYKMTCDQIETMASEYLQMLNVSITSCNDEADFFKDMDSEDEQDGDANEEDNEDQEDGDTNEDDSKFEISSFEHNRGRFAVFLSINDKDVMRKRKWNTVRKSITARVCEENVKTNIRLFTNEDRAVLRGKVKKTMCATCGVDVFVGEDRIGSYKC